MKGYISDIERATLDNTAYRRVLYTAKHVQLVLMALAPGEEIGEEVHDLDQFIRVESGHGVVVIDGVETELADGSAIVIPEGARHNVLNTGKETLKLYTLYGPPEHKDGIVHATKADSETAHEHFDGVTTE